MSFQVHELPLVGSAVSVVFLIMILTHLDHMIPLLSLKLNSRSSAQGLAVDHCIGFYQLLNVGSMVTTRNISNLIIGEG